MIAMEVYVDASFGSIGYRGVSSGGLGIFSVKDKEQAIAINVSGENLNIIRLEVLAIQSALIIYKDEQDITIHTDNQHCYDSLVTSREYYINNEWRRVNSQHIAELDIILQCEELISIRSEKSYKTTIKKVVSHSGNVYHDAADKLAYAAMTNQKSGIKNFMSINILNCSKFSIVEIRRLIPEYLKITIEDITEEMKRLSISIQKPKQKTTSAQDIKYTFLLCHSCAQIVLFQNMKGSPTLIDVISIVYLTECRTCVNNYGKVNDSSKIMDITRIIFMDSDIYNLMTEIASLNSTLTVRPFLLAYEETSTILSRYSNQYTICSIDTKERKCFSYLESGFF